MTHTIESLHLPVDLAPALCERIRALLAEVSPTTAPVRSYPRGAYRGPQCVVCHQGGKLGGHHSDDGEVVWIHHRCHRRLHRRGYGTTRPRRRTAC